MKLNNRICAVTLAIAAASAIPAFGQGSDQRNDPGATNTTEQHRDYGWLGLLGLAGLFGLRRRNQEEPKFGQTSTGMNR